MNFFVNKIYKDFHERVCIIISFISKWSIWYMKKNIEIVFGLEDTAPSVIFYEKIDQCIEKWSEIIHFAIMLVLVPILFMPMIGICLSILFKANINRRNETVVWYQLHSFVVLIVFLNYHFTRAKSYTFLSTLVFYTSILLLIHTLTLF